ncbi:hypothetical protein N7505_007466 [Penicillium chrysogenum]|uniref:Uncharacterized protein n=1 Tax=Penicillium chrysogenum TaxID=5076 RepID=A0ABQ8WES7_PENCH|nr:hypothetical protein N7505_007466 [Penicillium chrysogenum]
MANKDSKVYLKVTLIWSVFLIEGTLEHESFGFTVHTYRQGELIGSLSEHIRKEETGDLPKLEEALS